MENRGSYSGKGSYNKNDGSNRGYSNGYNKGYGNDKKKVEFKIPSDYLKNGYYDKKEDGTNIIKVSLVRDTAEFIAQGLHGDDLTYGQLRKFFEEVVKIRFNANKGVYSEDKAIVKLNRLVPLAEYLAAKPNTSHVDKSFLAFIKRNVELVHNREDLDAFFLHFEAIVGYFKKWDKGR